MSSKHSSSVAWLTAGFSDDSLVDSILRAGALATVPRDILSSNMPQLLDMGMFSHD